MEKVQLDFWRKLNIIFPTAFAPHQTSMTTPDPDVATSTMPTAPTVPPTIQEKDTKKKKTSRTSSIFEKSKAKE